MELGLGPGIWQDTQGVGGHRLYEGVELGMGLCMGLCMGQMGAWRIQRV